MEYHGRYTQPLKTFFDDILSVKKNGYPDQGHISEVVENVSYEQLLEMFPDIEEMDRGVWSSHSIFAVENDEYVLEISLYRETYERIAELQNCYPDVMVSDEYYMAFFVGGSVSQNIGGDLYTDHSFVVALDNKIVGIQEIL